MSYISPTDELSTFLVNNWTETPVCYPNSPEPDLAGSKYWLRVYAFQSSDTVTLGDDNRHSDQGLFYLDVVGQPNLGTGEHTRLAALLAKLLQTAYINGVSMQQVGIAPVQGYDAEGRYVMRVTAEYVVDYEY